MLKLKKIIVKSQFEHTNKVLSKFAVSGDKNQPRTKQKQNEKQLKTGKRTKTNTETKINSRKPKT